MRPAETHLSLMIVNIGAIFGCELLMFMIRCERISLNKNQHGKSKKPTSHQAQRGQ